MNRCSLHELYHKRYYVVICEEITTEDLEVLRKDNLIYHTRVYDGNMGNDVYYWNTDTSEWTQSNLHTYEAFSKLPEATPQQLQDAGIPV